MYNIYVRIVLTRLYSSLNNCTVLAQYIELVKVPIDTLTLFTNWAVCHTSTAGFLAGYNGA